MYQKHDNGVGRIALSIIIEKVCETIIIMIGRKTRVSVSRGLQALPFFAIQLFAV